MLDSNQDYTSEFNLRDGDGMPIGSPSQGRGEVPDFEILLEEELSPKLSLSELEDDPGGYLRAVYDEWVKLGGYSKGKPRHSVRRIKEWLKEDNDEVRSLETKLAGRTWVQKGDAESLLRLFFRKWQYLPEQDKHASHPSGWEKMTGEVLSRLFSDDRPALLLPERTREGRSDRPVSVDVQVASRSLQEKRRSRDVIKELYRNSTAMVVISRERSIIGPDPALSMGRFYELMSDLNEIDKVDEADRALIWMVDIGLRDDFKSSRQVFLNVESLAAQFRSLLLIERENRDELWDWLSSRAVVVVGSLRQQEIDCCYEKADVNLPQPKHDLQWFAGDRLFLEAAPIRWLQRMADLTGAPVTDDSWRQPFTAHFSKDGWGSDPLSNAIPDDDLRFFYHVISSSLQEDGRSKIENQFAQCVELGSPGRRWSEAFRLAITAAFARLGWKFGAGSIDDGFEAMAQLRRHGFAILNLRDFIRLTNNLIDARLSVDN